MLNSRGLALLLSISVATVTTAFLSLLPSISNSALLVVIFLSFSSSYILFRLVMEFLFFKEINSIYEALERIQHKDLSFLMQRSRSSFNPLRIINTEIYNYAELKQREIAELKRMENFRREFIADVSHELKTPLFAAQGFVHTLLDGAVEDKKVRTKFLKKAAKSLDGLNILVQDLLTISQMETGEIKMHYDDFDIVELIKEVYEQLEVKADKKKIQLQLDKIYEDPVFVYADYQRIYQVITNLVTNAVKYTKKEGTVIISILQSEDKGTIYVKDDGIGIPEADLSRVFERFYRVDKSRSKEKGGTGLGLSIVKHIMEAHGSAIKVESQMGVGSTFWFDLQLGKAPKPMLIDEED